MQNKPETSDEDRAVTFEYYLNNPEKISKNEKHELILRARGILERHDRLPSTIARIERQFGKKIIEIRIDGKTNYLIPSNQKIDGEILYFNITKSITLHPDLIDICKKVVMN